MATPWVASVKLFALKSNEQFMPSGPTPLDSRQWQEDYNETKDFGSLNSTVRTADQTTIGLFWADSGPVLWQRAQRVVQEGAFAPGQQRFRCAHAFRCARRENERGPSGSHVRWFTP